MNETAGKAQSILRNHDKAAAENLIHQAEEIALLASQKGQSDWKKQESQLNKLGALGRIRALARHRPQRLNDSRHVLITVTSVDCILKSLLGALRSPQINAQSCSIDRRVAKILLHK